MKRLLLVYLAGSVHFDVNGRLAGVDFDEGRFGGMEKSDKVEPGMGQGASDGKSPARPMLDVVERLPNIPGVVDVKGDDFFQIVKLRDELRSEKGREPLDRESAVAVGGAAGVGEATDDAFVNALEFGQVELSKAGWTRQDEQKDE